jgi:uncharacterized membrane protein YphA (DoxX/SURF4 family)
MQPQRRCACSLQLGRTAAAPVKAGACGAPRFAAGFYRWAGALMLACFTIFATFIANRFLEMPPTERFAAQNSFFEHLGLVGGFLLVAWHDLPIKKAGN